jgi:hypothetical protein
MVLEDAKQAIKRQPRRKEIKVKAMSTVCAVLETVWATGVSATVAAIPALP